MLCTVCISCHSPYKHNMENEPVTQTEKVVAQTLDNKEVPVNVLDITREPLADFDWEEELAGNSKGKFFNEKAEFFIIENPKNKLYGSKINSIRLYYLEKQLSQTKYFLHSNITNKLINMYGDFTITGFDFDNRDEIENGNIILQKRGSWQLREEFDNYRLAWTLGDKEILIRVNMRDTVNTYIYTERSAIYKDMFRSLEYEN